MQDWLRLLRVSGMLTLGSNALAVVAVGFHLGEVAHLRWLLARLHDQWQQAAWILASSLCIYVAGMVWNDLMDVARDRLRRPERPLAAGRIGLTPAYTVGLLAIAGALLCAMPVPSGVPMAGIVLSLALLYDLGLKQVPVLGAFALGLVRASHALFLLLILGADHLRLALLQDGPPEARRLLWYPIAIGVYTMGLSLLGELEDRARHGSRLAWLAGGAVLLGGLGGALAILLSAPWLGSWWHAGATGKAITAATLGTALGLAAWIGWSVGSRWWTALRTCACDDVGPVVGAALAGMVLFDAVVAAAGHPLLGLACLALVPLFRLLAPRARMD